MNLTGNTIFITGATSGLGRAWAEAFHKLGNQVIISGRRKGHLAEITKANPGMQAVELDVENPASIAAVCKKLIADYPKLNAVINNAGIMQLDDTSTVSASHLDHRHQSDGPDSRHLRPHRALQKAALCLRRSPDRTDTIRISVSSAPSVVNLLFSAAVICQKLT